MRRILVVALMSALAVAMTTPAMATSPQTRRELDATAAKAKRKKAIKRGPRGKRGPQGARGPIGASGQNGVGGASGAQGATGPQGATGAQGPAGPFPDLLPSGKTVRGTYGLASEGATDLAMTGLSYVFTLGSTPTPHVVQSAGPTPAGCLGNATNPSANPGHLCVFEVAGGNHATTYPVVLTNTRFGAVIYLFAAGAGFAYSSGTWAATAA